MAEEILTLIRGLITIAVLIPISALILKLSTKIFKLDNQSFKTAFIIALIADGLGFIVDSLNRLFVSAPLFEILDWIITIALVVFALFLVKIFYKVKWGKSALVWLVWMVIMMVIGIIVNFILVIIFTLTGLLS